MMTTTINFVQFPFTCQGVNFTSKIAETSRYLPQIMMMGESWVEMNISTINDFIPNLSELTIDELKNKIAYINDGGSEMFIELAEG